MSNPDKKRQPPLTVIHGGRERTKVEWEIVRELAAPRELDHAKLADLNAKIAPRGKLTLVPKFSTTDMPPTDRWQ